MATRQSVVLHQQSFGGESFQTNVALLGVLGEQGEYVLLEMLDKVVNLQLAPRLCHVVAYRARQH